jgi:hypothetical protein
MQAKQALDSLFTLAVVASAVLFAALAALPAALDENQDDHRFTAPEVVIAPSLNTAAADNPNE